METQTLQNKHAFNEMSWGYLFLTLSWLLLLSYCVIDRPAQETLVTYSALGMLLLSSSLFVASLNYDLKNTLSVVMLVSSVLVSAFTYVEPTFSSWFFYVVLIYLAGSCLAYSGRQRLWYQFLFLPFAIILVSATFNLNLPIAKPLITQLIEFIDLKSLKGLLSFAVFAVSLLVIKLRSTEYLVRTENLKLRDTLQQAKEKAKVADQAMQVAHDIRSPLSAINAIESKDYMPEEHKQLLRDVVKRIDENCSKLMGQDRDSVRIPVEIRRLVEEVILEKKMVNPSLNINFNNAQEPMVSYVDEALAQNLVSNIINNAIEALPEEKGSVNVSLSYKGKCNILEISDDGKGMNKATLQKLGEKGFTEGKENSENSGHGLGVNSAKNWLSEWGGQIKYRSFLGRGTKVQITLPRV